MARPRKSIPPDAEEKIRELALKEYLSPSQIHRAIGGVVDLRTVQRRVKEYREPIDISDLWTLGDSEPEDAPLVLEVFAEVAARTQGAVRIRRATAEWLVRVRRAAPSLPLYMSYSIANEYRRATANNDVKYLRALDTLLAFRPWESPAAAERFEKMVLAERETFNRIIFWGPWWRKPDELKETTRIKLEKDWWRIIAGEPKEVPSIKIELDCSNAKPVREDADER